MKPEMSFMMNEYGFSIMIYGKLDNLPAYAKLSFTPKELRSNKDLKSLLTLMKLKCENALRSLED